MGPAHRIDHRVKVTRTVYWKGRAGAKAATLQSPLTLPARLGLGASGLTRDSEAIGISWPWLVSGTTRHREGWELAPLLFGG